MDPGRKTQNQNLELFVIVWIFFLPSSCHAGLTLLREPLITWAASNMETVAVWSTLCSKWNTKCLYPGCTYVVVDTCAKSPLVDTCVIPIDTCWHVCYISTCWHVCYISNCWHCVLPIGTCWHVCYISTCWHVCEVRTRVGLAWSRRNFSRSAHCSTQLSRQEMVVSSAAPQHWARSYALHSDALACSCLCFNIIDVLLDVHLFGDSI